MENFEKDLDIKEIIAKNIIKYRKELGLTQLELAEKLNYSDKTLSKWERAESVPDIMTLKQLADLFNITVDSLISDAKQSVPTPKKNIEKGLTKNKLISITLLSVAIVWLVATIAFVIIKLLETENIIPNILRPWLSFIYAIPVSSIVLLVFSCIWGNKIHRFFTTSILLWSIAISLDLSFSIASGYLFYIVVIPLQIMAFIYFILYKKKV